MKMTLARPQVLEKVAVALRKRAFLFCQRSFKPSV